MLRVVDGFDHYNNATDLGQRAVASGQKLSWAVGSGVTVFTPGRNGNGKAVNVVGLGVNQSTGSIAVYASLLGSFDTNYSTLFLGQAILMHPQDPGTSGGIVNIVDFFPMDLTVGVGGTQQCRISLNEYTGALSIYDGGGVLKGVAANVVPRNTWFSLQFEIISATSGTVAVRINNQPVLTVTGMVTNQSGNNFVNGLLYRCNGSTGGNSFPGATGCLIDDFNLCDTVAGSSVIPTDTFLGDVRVSTIFAVGNGSTIQWTPLSGTNWQMISETAFDGDTTYNSTSTITGKDLFVFQALANTVNNVIGVQFTGAYRKNDAGDHSVKHAILSHAVEVDGSAMVLSASYTYLSDMYEINPCTSAVWSAADVNAIQAGYIMVS